jgi:tetratricopeptide (TPR) repeat protein
MRLLSLLAGAVLTIAAAAPAAAQIPTTFTNLQVLPKDIPRPELIATMRNIAGSLGVRCAHCHVGPDDLTGMNFATDEKRSKVAARAMLQMVRNINTEFVGRLPAGESTPQQVTCLTCHRRSIKPPRPLPELLLNTMNENGVPAAIAQYRKLRAEAMDAGLYDFREPTLAIVATTLREQKRLAEAMEFLKLNAEIFPNSVNTQMLLGELAVQKGDPEAAAGFYKRALELDPANAAAKKALENLKR